MSKAECISINNQVMSSGKWWAGKCQPAQVDPSVWLVTFSRHLSAHVGNLFKSYFSQIAESIKAAECCLFDCLFIFSLLSNLSSNYLNRISLPREFFLALMTAARGRAVIYSMTHRLCQVCLKASVYSRVNREQLGLFHCCLKKTTSSSHPEGVERVVGRDTDISG